MRKVVLVTLSLLGTAAFAAEPSEAEQRAACTGDVLRFCFSEIPNRARISECMIARKASLSPNCRAMVNLTIESRRTARN